MKRDRHNAQSGGLGEAGRGSGTHKRTPATEVLVETPSTGLVFPAPTEEIVGVVAREVHFVH